MHGVSSAHIVGNIVGSNRLPVCTMSVCECHPSITLALRLGGATSLHHRASLKFRVYGLVVWVKSRNNIAT